MERLIGLAIVAAGVDDRQKRLAQPANLGALGVAGALCRQPYHLNLQRAPHFKQAQYPLAFQPHNDRHGPIGSRQPGSQVGADATLAPDQADPLPAIQCLANGGAANAKLPGKQDLWRKPVADLEPGALHHFGQRLQHRGAARAVVQRFQVA